MNNEPPLLDTVKKTYFRSYGTHVVAPLNPGDHPDYIVSFPSWKQTRLALQDFPARGNVITPEYTTTEDGPLTWTENPGQIHRNIEEAKELTQGSEATLYLGTPYHIWSNSHQKTRWLEALDVEDGVIKSITFKDTEPRSDPQWLNAVLAIRNGEIISTTYKQNPLPAETMFLGMQKPTTDPRQVLGGNAVLICNELFLHTKNRDDFVLKDQDVRQVFSPSFWPIPVKVPADLDPDKVKDGDDEYYRARLEKYVASGVFDVMHTVKRVVVADLGRTGFPYPFTNDIAPYNAVFDRIV